VSPLHQRQFQHLSSMTKHIVSANYILTVVDVFIIFLFQHKRSRVLKALDTLPAISVTIHIRRPDIHLSLSI